MRRLVAVATFLLMASASLAAQDSALQVPDLDKKPYSVGGNVEVRPLVLWIDRDAVVTRLRYFGLDVPRTSAQFNSRVQLDAEYVHRTVSLQTTTVFDMNRIDADWSSRVTSYEAYASWRPSPTFGLDVGKKTLKWGKGYAWNPVAFVDRPKNPDDPALALEGFVVVSADVIKSFKGPLQTLSFTPVLIPVSGPINATYGESGHLNHAGRLYLLLYDTDIDVLYLTGGSRPGRTGVDVSRNIGSNVEVHAEVAYVRSTAPSWSHVVGVRILARTNTTLVVETYRNGAGFTTEAMRDYFTLADSALASGDAARIQGVTRLAKDSFGGAQVMRDYLYVRASQPDLFGAQYLSGAVTGIYNRQDGSFSLTQETSYRMKTNLELRTQLGVIAGKRETEFGDKLADVRFEFRARYFF
jgi:hypothetical protein